MDIGKNFTFITEDEDWMKKIGLAAVCFLPIINMVGVFAFYGYLKRMFRNVLEGAERPLPEWEDFGGLIVDGLKAVVVLIGWAVPTILLIVAVTVLNIAGASARSDALHLAGTGCMCLTIPIGLVFGILGMVGLMRFFASESLGDAFAIGEVIGFIKGNIGPFLLALLVFMGAMLAAEIAGLLMCIIGIFVTMPYAMLVGWKGFADVYREAAAKAV